MYLVSDQEMIFNDQDDEVQLSFVATDFGTMDVTITDYDVVTGDVSAIKEYSSIAMKEGKAFSTSVLAVTSIGDMALEVVDKKGNRRSFVNQQGKPETFCCRRIKRWKIKWSFCQSTTGPAIFSAKWQ